MILLTKGEQVTDHILVLVGNCVEDWFPPERALPTEDFIDRLCNDYLNPEGKDIEDLDTAAVRKIMRTAHEARREMA